MRIEFFKNSSKYYPVAVTLAREADTFEYNEETGRCISQFSIPSTAKFVQLAKMVSKWQGSLVTCGPHIVEIADMKRLQYVYRCYLEGEQYEYRDQYCWISTGGSFDLQVPCKIVPLNMMNMVIAWSERYSHMDVDGNIHFHKEQILAWAEHRVRDTWAQLCPRFNWEMVKDCIVKDWPDTIPAEQILYSENEKEHLGERKREAKEFDQLLGDIPGIDEL